MNRPLTAIAAAVRAALTEYDTDADAGRVAQALRLRDLLEAEGIDAWQFNDLVWRELRDQYADLELNPTFIEVWAP